RKSWGLILPIDYSSRKLSTGLATAALIACQLTVNKAINNAASPATANIHHSIVVRKANSFNHVFIPHHAIGDAMRTAKSTSRMDPLDSNWTLLPTLAPSALRMSISFTRWRTVYGESPNRPSQEMKI